MRFLSSQSGKMTTTCSTKSVRLNKSNINCCVPECTKPGYVIEDGVKITFHRLPIKREALLKEWIVKIRRDIGRNFKVTAYTKICSRHFKVQDFRTTPTGMKKLNKHVVPSIFAWTETKELVPCLKAN